MAYSGQLYPLLFLVLVWSLYFVTQQLSSYHGENRDMLDLELCRLHFARHCRPKKHGKPADSLAIQAIGKSSTDHGLELCDTVAHKSSMDQATSH